MATPSSEDTLVGAVIAERYRIISRIGAGGMGIAYRAWDRDTGVPVVIKTPKRSCLDDPRFKERFARETRLLQALDHPHVVPIRDLGEHEGLPYVVMRFLPGGSLSNRRLRDEHGKPRANPPGMLHFWLPAVASALDHIHARGIVHRDVKPGNIFFDAFWGAFVGDFGIAKIVDDSDGFERERTLTATGMVTGTPEYMAPERFTPRATIDGRTDQYALAVMVYEMLSGGRPFRGESSHLIVEVLTQSPPPLVSPKVDLPATLVDAVRWGLAKSPDDRFPDCSAFSRAVLQEVAPMADEPDIARLLCPQCANLLKLPVDAVGRIGKCPKCRKKMKVADDLGALWLLDEERRTRRSRSRGPDAEAETEASDASPDTGGLALTPTPSEGSETLPSGIVRLDTTPPPRRAAPPPRPPLPLPLPSWWLAGGAAAGVAAVLGIAAVTLLPAGGPEPGPRRSAGTYAERLARARTALEADPRSAADNAFVGRHLCFKTGDWVEGLPLLARGGDDALARAAAAELAAGADPAALIRAAKAWWDIAADALPSTDEAWLPIRAHAKALYLANVTKLSDRATVTFVERWLDNDADFLQLVGNKRPGGAARPPAANPAAAKPPAAP